MNVAVNETDHDIAANWAIRIDSGEINARDHTRLDAWLREDQRRLGALLRAQAALSYLDRGKALAAGHAFDKADLPQANDISWFNWADLRRARFAGSTLVACFLMLVSVSFFRNSADLPMGQPNITANVASAANGIALEDGSFAHVKAGSVIKIAMNSKQRDIRLEKGEVWFKVAHDENRPFVVAAGNIRVRAVGTAFSVRLRADGADVVVSEGVVETWVDGLEGNRTRLGAGMVSFVANALPDANLKAKPAKAGGPTPKVKAELALNGESVAYAVAEMNRYNDTKLIVDNAAIGREPLVGLFRTDSPLEFAEAVASVTGAQVSEREGIIYIER